MLIPGSCYLIAGMVDLQVNFRASFMLCKCRLSV